MADPVEITFLGGLGDIGRNCATIEQRGEMLILDCGQMFASEMRPGVDSVLPALEHIVDNGDKVIGMIATHGHEDHVGAIAHVLPHVPLTIYGTPFTLSLARNRAEEARLLDRVTFVPVEDGDRLSIGSFECEFIPVTHSVPGGLISAITTDQGLVLHSSDFKLDHHPIDGRRTDLPRIGALAHDPGIRLMLADSTNADEPGSSQSESEIGPTLRLLFEQHAGRRIITACFSSHLHRVQQIANAAIASGRKIATLGMSMKRNVAAGRETGVIRLPDASIIDIGDIGDYDPGEICVISTGSQGEERSSLALAAAGRSSWIQIGPNDTILLSSTPIPGNDLKIAQMINRLVEVGAIVETAGALDLHTSGHGKRDELTVLHLVASPEWFVPVHGELRHMTAHAELAQDLGMSPDRTLVARDGDSVVLSDDGLALHKDVAPGHHLLLNGPFIGPDRGLVGERQILGEYGTVIATVCIDPDHRALVAEPVIVARGWLDHADERDLITEMTRQLGGAVEEFLDDTKDAHDTDELGRIVRRTIGSAVNDLTGRRPMIVPVVLLADD
ncbi:MAG: ribonuclease J [Acidimicrobiales bacterium]